MQNKKRPPRVISDAERQQVATTAPTEAPEPRITIDYLYRQPHIVLTALVLVMREIMLTRLDLFGPLEETKALVDDNIRETIADFMAELKGRRF